MEMLRFLVKMLSFLVEMLRFLGKMFRFLRCSLFRKVADGENVEGSKSQGVSNKFLTVFMLDIMAALEHCILRLTSYDSMYFVNGHLFLVRGSGEVASNGPR